MKTLKHLIAIFFMIVSNVIFCQNNQLEKLRIQYSGKNYETYIDNKRIYEGRLELPPPTPKQLDKRDNKLIKLFTIPLNERLKLFPFNKYDSIYIATPNCIENIEEPRNYLDKKYHKTIRIIKKNEIKKLTNILFNYYLLIYTPTIKTYYKTCCIENEYPKFILLFKKDGEFINFMAFPDDGKKRTNFISGNVFDYYKEFDLCEEKETLILDLFGFEI